MNSELLDIAQRVVVQAKDVLHSGLGAGVAFMYGHSKEKMRDRSIKISYTLLFIHLIIGFFLGYVLGDFIPKDLQYRDGMLCLIGVASYRLLGVLQNKVIDTVIDKFLK